MVQDNINTLKALLCELSQVRDAMLITESAGYSVDQEELERLQRRISMIEMMVTVLEEREKVKQDVQEAKS